MAYQRQNWQANDSGILRKKDENEEELLVFGYSCKLFRDDEKAIYVDQGKHLIPWMGDESLRIDRYDVRGALYDLSQYEAISGQQEELFWINLSSEERRIEQLCDEERYRALTHNEDEERLYQEEELKRLHQALGTDKTYGQVSYSYDEENEETEKPVSDNQTDDVDEPFIPPPELDLPQDIAAPETVKLNAIIEKTALFINQQGSQMEIILKMKQASNPQFEFLSYLSPLHAYYRYVLNAIKGGRYKPKILSANDAEKKAEEENASDQNYYLHHSLSQVPTSSVDVAPVIPSINYKPSADCAYSMLVNKIKNNQNKLLLSKTNSDITNESPEVTVVKRDDKNVKLTNSPKIHDEVESVDGNFEDDSDAVLKPSSPQVHVPLSRSSRRKRRKRQQGGFAYNDVIDKDYVDATESKEHEPETIDEQTEQESVDTLEEQYETPPTDLQLIIDKMACYVGKNGRDFEEIVKSKADPRFSFLDISNPYHIYYRKKVEFYELSHKPVENLVSVVNSNENNVNANGKECEDDPVENEDSIKVSHMMNANGKPVSSQKPNPVSFSIKRPKETESLEIKSALPVEESTDEEIDENEDGDGNANDKTNTVETNLEQTVVDNSANVNVRNSVSSSANPNVKSCLNSNRHVSSVQEKRTEDRVKEKLVTKDKEKLLTKDKEKVLTKDKEKPSVKDKEKLSVKDKEKLSVKDKEKLSVKDKEKPSMKDKEKPSVKEKDKLSVKDKEKLLVKDKEKASVKDKEKLLVKEKEKPSVKEKDKLSTMDKEKQLQLERKKRAAAFLNLLQKTNNKPVVEDEVAPVMIGPQLPDELKIDEKSDSASVNEEDSDSASSPPSSVTSPEVTVIGETTLNPIVSPVRKVFEEDAPVHSKPKRSKYSMPEKYVSRHLRDRNDVEYKHKHRKRKRSRTPSRKRSHSSRSRVHRSSKESKHRKHHRHHRKEWRHSDREYNSSSVHRRHKHSKLKKHKRKESKSNSTEDSDSV